jgi:hypothetical protein
MQTPVLERAFASDKVTHIAQLALLVLIMSMTLDGGFEPFSKRTVWLQYVLSTARPTMALGFTLAPNVATSWITSLCSALTSNDSETQVHAVDSSLTVITEL